MHNGFDLVHLNQKQKRIASSDILVGGVSWILHDMIIDFNLHII